jgi:hypothetical protein
MTQIGGMEISIIFDTAYQGKITGAVWIVESDENRRRFERQTNLDDRSALFTPEGSEIGRAAILRSIWNVQEHYPEWSRIDVHGSKLTGDLANELRGEGAVTETDEGFSLART